MIIYLSYPFPHNDINQVKSAVREISRYVALLSKEQPHCIIVNAVFESYEPSTPPYFFPRIHGAAAGPLIQAAQKLIVVRAKGWEYSDIMREEVTYANFLGKEVVYVDPIPAKATNGK